MLETLTQEYGSVVGFYFGVSPELLVSDLDILKNIMVKDFDSFMDRPSRLSFMVGKPNSPTGLVAARGEVWKTSRRTITPTFSASKMKMMVPLIKRSTDNLLEEIQKVVESGMSREVFKMFGAFTMETIVATAFGRLVDIQKGENDELTEYANNVFRGLEDGNRSSFFSYLPLLSNFPFIAGGLLRRLVSRSKLGKSRNMLKEVALNLVKTRRESQKQGKYKDMLQLLLDASVQEVDSPEDSESTPNSRCPMDKKLSDDQIVALCIGFLLAGYETTANTLAYTAYLLALNPGIQERLQEEIDSYFQEKTATEENIYEASQEIAYLEMVIQESLRLYPPAPLTVRSCMKTVTINGVTIPKGVTVTIPIAMLHKSPKYWTDPETFNPDRFTAEEKAKRPQLCYMPFGFGPRNCVGMRFAMLEAKTALIEVLRKFTFVRCPETEVPLQTVVGITMSPKNGIFLKIVPRD